VAQHGEVGDGEAGPDAAVVLTEGDVEHSVELVFDAPMAPNGGERPGIGREAAEAVAVWRAEPAGTPRAASCQQAERSHPELFTFVADPAAPPTNNGAERALRPLVVARNVSGASRSLLGSQLRIVLQLAVATRDLRSLDSLTDPLPNCWLCGALHASRSSKRPRSEQLPASRSLDKSGSAA
jgi:hypothetical protein